MSEHGQKEGEKERGSGLPFERHKLNKTRF